MSQRNQDQVRLTIWLALRRASRCGSALLTGLVLMLPMLCCADAPTREDKIKAAIVYKIGKFVDWPERAFAGSDAPLRVCQFGEDTIAMALSAIAGRTVQGRMIEFEVVSRQVAAQRLGCHILYFPRSSAARAQSVLRDLSGRPVLTISDLPEFARHGGMVALIRSGDRLSFEIAPEAARDAGLRVHAQLLDLADIVGNRR